MTSWCLTGPISSDNVTAIATVGLFMVALFSALYALWQYRMAKREKREERTLALIDDWMNKTLRSFGSPAIEARRLMDYAFGTFEELAVGGTQTEDFKRLTTIFNFVCNYFYDVAFLAKRGIIDVDLLVDNLDRPLSRTAKCLLAYNDFFVEHCPGNAYTMRPVRYLGELADKALAKPLEP